MQLNVLYLILNLFNISVRNTQYDTLMLLFMTLYSRLNCAKTWNSLGFFFVFIRSLPFTSVHIHSLPFLDGISKEINEVDVTKMNAPHSAGKNRKSPHKDRSKNVEVKAESQVQKSPPLKVPSPAGNTSSKSKPSASSPSKIIVTMPRNNMAHPHFSQGYHVQHYGYHNGPRASPGQYQHPVLYTSAYRPDMYNYQTQHHLPMGSPSFSMPSDIYYEHPAAPRNRARADDHKSRENSVKHSENDENLKPDAIKSSLKQGKPLETKTSPPIPSPPPKKRRIVGSWDEDADRNEDVGAASPGMFRSPLPGEKMQGGRNFFVSFSFWENSSVDFVPYFIY